MGRLAKCNEATCEKTSKATETVHAAGDRWDKQPQWTSALTTTSYVFLLHDTIPQELWHALLHSMLSSAESAGQLGKQTKKPPITQRSIAVYQSSPFIDNHPVHIKKATLHMSTND